MNIREIIKEEIEGSIGLDWVKAIPAYKDEGQSIMVDFFRNHTTQINQEVIQKGRRISTENMLYYLNDNSRYQKKAPNPESLGRIVMFKDVTKKEFMLDINIIQPMFTSLNNEINDLYKVRDYVGVTKPKRILFNLISDTLKNHLNMPNYKITMANGQQMEYKDESMR